MSTFRFFLFTVCLVVSVPMLGQTEKAISGKVLANNDNEPLIGAQVLTNENTGTITDEEGNFSLKIPRSVEQITITYLGYTPKTIQLQANETDLGTIVLELNPTSLSEIIVTASSQNFRDDFVGSNFRLNPKLIQRSNPLNTEELLRIVPGVNIVGDMGLSNRPNISIRGSWGRRSKKILLMEDGTPAAPAPYIAPGAYYNPVSDRVQAIEVYKGADMLRYGPNNMYGGINYITALPPQKPELRFKLIGGQRNYTTGLFSYGGTWNNLGALVEGVYKKFDGFTDNSSVKVLNLNAKIFSQLSEDQSLYFKVSGQFEDNQASLSSITPFTFKADPTQNPFDADKFTMRRYGLDIIHKWLPNPNISLTSKIYASDFERDWWRQVTTMVKAAEVKNYLGEGIYQNRYSYLDNHTFTEDDYVRVGRVVNSRESTTDSRWIFTVSGFRELFALDWNAGEKKHQLEASFKLHQETYKNRFLVADSSRWARSGKPTTDQQFDMWSASGFIRNRFNLNTWAFTPIIRVEHVNMNQQNLLALSSDPNVQNPDEYTLNNSYTIVLPGLTAGYKNVEHELFASIYRGFIAPSKVFGFFVERNGVLTAPTINDELNIRPELSVNVELGWRGSLFSENLLGQVTYFNNSVKNFVAAGENELFRKPGKVNIQGVESSLATSLTPNSSLHQVTLNLNATLMQTKVLEGAVEDRDLFGSIVHSQATKNEFIAKVNNNRNAFELYTINGQGNEVAITDAILVGTQFDNISRAVIHYGNGLITDAKVPYTPELNLSGNINYQYQNLSIGFTGSYVGGQYTEFANFESESADGGIGKLKSYFNMDAQVGYDFSVKGINRLNVFMNAKNITNNVYRASRLNRAASGVFPGGFRQIIAGINITI